MPIFWRWRFHTLKNVQHHCRLSAGDFVHINMHGFSALNLTQLQHSTRYNGTCVGLDISVESTTNGPYLSLPQDLTNLDPAWSTCNAVL